MNVKELIEELQKYPEDMQVRLYTDHGQIPMKPGDVSKAYIEEDSYMPSEVEEADYLNGDFPDAIPVIFIDAV